MLIISQNLTNYDIPIPKNAIFRVNLAWCDSIDELKNILKKHSNTKIFLDLPTKRIKPPNNRYTVEDLIPIINSNKQIHYLAISNVESSSDLQKYFELLPKNVTVIPKIESSKAIENLQNIASILPGPEKIFMLDHDDLFSNILKKNEAEPKFKEYIKMLIKFCDKNNIKLLRTVGVVFNDEEKRVSQYVN
jgi:hypothetical protein